jgi:23S rRNA pseudouridine2605 synthase
MTATDNAPREGDRIAKLLARAGVASRREVERMIAEGRVKLDGELVTTPATVLKSLRGVTVDDKPVKAAEATRLFLFHKPSGLLTAEHDPAGRPTIYAALRNSLPESAGRVMPIGRLDYNTEGLLLLTNDGALKRAMELPSSGIPRTYRARTYGDVTQEQLESLVEGIEVDGMRYGRIDANMERKTGRNQWIELTIREGKNREIRRVLEFLGLEVSRLMRTSYGPFELLNLPRGAAVEIRQVDVEKFCRALLGDGAVNVPLTAPQQAQTRIARTTPRHSPPPAPAEKPSTPRRGGPTKTGAKPGASSPRGPRKPDGRKPDARRTGSGKPAPSKSGPTRSGPTKSGPSKPGPRK